MNDYDIHYSGGPSAYSMPQSRGYVGKEQTEYTPYIVKEEDEVIEDIPTFDLDSFQVVRREFFSHISEPSISFCDYKIGLNAACIKRMPDTDYIQFLVNRQTKTLAVRPCQESDLHSFQWCTTSGGKRKPRQVTGKMFFMKIFTMMDWNPDYRYKILGKLIRANGQYLFVFDLTSTEMYRRIVKEGEKTKTSRVPVFPAEWQDQFGVPFEEHRKQLQINIFDSYTVFGIKDKDTEETPTTALPASSEPYVSTAEATNMEQQALPMSQAKTPIIGGERPWQNPY